MAATKIIRYPEPSLRWVCQRVEFPLTDEVRRHIDALQDTLMITPGGLALASNQILADGLRLFVVRPGSDLPRVVINPSWESRSPLIETNEGCLSVPGLQIPVRRHEELTLTYQDELGDPKRYWATGLEAQVVQHECAHLDGWLVVDALPPRLRAEFKALTIRNRKRGK